VYDGLIDGMVTDEPVAGLAVHRTEVGLGSPDERRRVAAETLAFAETLGR
jgi:hypothetical protein